MAVAGKRRKKRTAPEEIKKKENDFMVEMLFHHRRRWQQAAFKENFAWSSFLHGMMHESFSRGNYNHTANFYTFNASIYFASTSLLQPKMVIIFDLQPMAVLFNSQITAIKENFFLYGMMNESLSWGNCNYNF